MFRVMKGVGSVIFASAAAGGLMYGGNWVVKRASRNHDAALNQMMRELPDPEKDSRMREKTDHKRIKI
jgi:hypothetical protein